MTAAGQTGIDTHFKCTLVWGKDPTISLTGTVIRLSGESVSILIAETDARLVPELGRKIRIEIDWAVPARQTQKQLVCRGTVGHINADPSGMLLTCYVRSSRFRDDRVKAAGAPADKSSGWTM